MTHSVDVYFGSPPATMVASTLRRGRGVVTIAPGPSELAGLAEALLVEAAPQHAASDWAALAARGGAR